MQERGIYYTKLIKIFTVITCVVAIMLLSAFFLFLLNIDQREQHLLKSTLDVQINSTAQSINYIYETINRLSSDNNVVTWAKSEPESPEYYFYALKTYQILKAETTFQNFLNIDIAITTNDPSTFVISHNGTIAKKNFNTNLEHTIEEPEIYPIYDNDRLVGLTLISPRIIDKANIVVISSFKLSQELIDSEYFKLAISDSSRGESFATDKAFLKTLSSFKQSGEESFKKDGFTCYVYSYPSLGFTLIYGLAKNVRYIPIAIVAMLFISITIAFIFIFARLTKSLYKPVSDVITQISKSSLDSQDEFAIIKDNCQKIEKLNTELENALNEQYMLEEQQKYRAFIRGIPTKLADNDLTSFFSLAIAMQNNSEEKNINTLFIHLDTFAKNTPHLHTIRTNLNEVVLVQKSDSKKESEKTLIGTINAFLSSLDGDYEVNFAIADVVSGYNEIPHAYSSAKEIIQYRYKIRNKAILTKDDIDDSEPKLYFPFQDENKLITALLAGKNDALSIYDRLVETNLNRSLLPDELNKFVYMIIGIANRLFQELKEDPKRIIGKDIEWNSLYTNQDPIATLDSIRGILYSTIEFRHKEDKAEENKLIREMKEYINNHYMENIMLIDLSMAFNLTPKYCSSIFNQLSNDNFKNYLNNLRIQKACEMIEEDPEIKISWLSNKIGFTSSNTFIRVFKSHMGVTPKLFAEKIIKRRHENE